MKKLFVLFIGLISAITLNVTAFGANTSKDDINTAIIKAVRDCNASVDISSYNIAPKDALNIFFQMHYTNSEFAYVDSNARCEYKGNVAKKLYFTYIDTPANVAKQKAMADSELNKIVAKAKEGKTDVEKVKIVHDKLLLNTSYDESLKKFTPYELLVNKSGVCTAYAFTFDMAMKKLGIDSQIAYSVTMGHEWNVIKINDKWYHVDLTFDSVIQQEMGLVSYANLLKSDSFMKLTGHYGWVTNDNIVCADTAFDNEFE